jgi:hypothetical protein
MEEGVTCPAIPNASSLTITSNGLFLQGSRFPSHSWRYLRVDHPRNRQFLCHTLHLVNLVRIVTRDYNIEHYGQACVNSRLKTPKKRLE